MRETDENRQAEGIWQFKKSVPIPDDHGGMVDSTYTFIYGNQRITLRLLSLHPGPWKSVDDFYQLAARWERDALFYLPPFGAWTELAVFQDGHFVQVGNGVKRIFERISEAEVIDWNRAILTPRPPYEYPRGHSGI